MQYQLIGSATPNAEDERNDLNDIKLGGFIFEPYNDGQYIVKATWYRAFDLPDFNPMAGPVVVNRYYDWQFGFSIRSNGTSWEYGWCRYFLH